MRIKKFNAELCLICILLTSICGIQKIYAHDIGVMGETYPIMEKDFLEFIQERVKEVQHNGQWRSLQNKMQQDATTYRDRPKSVFNITKATQTKTWKFDPTIQLDHDVRTPDGKLIAASGTRINPLSFISLSNTLIFFNGDDPEQVKWVLSQNKKLKGKTKLILVNGSVLEQEKLFSSPIYFDQEGRLTNRFQIKHVPAMVSQEGLHLKISEVLL